MRLPFFKPKDDPGITVPLPGLVESILSVYFRPEGEPPTADALRMRIGPWLAQHAPEPLHDLLQAYLATPMLTLIVEEKAKTPSPNLSLVRAFRPGEEELTRFVMATHVTVVAADDLLRYPRAGLWAAIAASRALADALSGVVAAQPCRLLPIKDNTGDLPADAGFAIGRVIVVPISFDKKGLGWMTTGGLHEFGLPELQVKNVPPNVQEPLAKAVCGLAQSLVRELFRQAGNQNEPLKALSLKREITITLDDITEAFAKPATHTPTAHGFATIGLHDASLRDGFLTVGPPAGMRIEHGVWLNGILVDLFGSQETLGHIAKGDERMEIAHRKAVSELPIARERFLAGLPIDARLYVKHGFPIKGDDHEYIWIVVNGWTGGQIRGQISNEPRYRLDLQAGQTVTVSESDVYDWMISYPDGRTEGNYTSQVLLDQG